MTMIIRCETVADIDLMRAVTLAAFAKPDDPEPAVEATLVDDLRADVGWIPALSLVAVVDGGVIGHAVSAPRSSTVLGAADALAQAMIVLLGSPGYYHRFEFGPASALGIVAPGGWGDDFQVRTPDA